MLSRTSRAISSAVPSLRLCRISASTTSAARQIHSNQRLATSFTSSQGPRLRRNFHSTPAARKGITPDSSDPSPPKPQSNRVAGGATHVAEPSPLTDTQYHEYSEHYLNTLLAEIERVQEEGSDLEAEYSAGVLSIIAPGVGTYVLNKQPPNKQIWLSSPISGPKRYDWVVQGDQMHEKQDTRGFLNGQWIYLRDGSNLTDLLNKELTISLPKDIYSDKHDS
ncbi:hypothetical protein VTN77DRAFT_8977 [Rasamsonia byssochlamydoides]|uniref:uncharacterized protein n=1 Tax=Rasamsonia byssochlamydoides TaxID=89139 RepID=UPI003743F17E